MVNSSPHIHSPFGAAVKVYLRIPKASVKGVKDKVSLQSKEHSLTLTMLPDA